MFGCTLNLSLCVRSREDPSRGFLECGLSHIDLDRVHLIDHSLGVSFKHRERGLLDGFFLFLVFITVGVILERLVLELNWLDGVDGAHGLGKCLVDKVSWLLFFEEC